MKILIGNDVFVRRGAIAFVENGYIEEISVTVKEFSVGYWSRAGQNIDGKENQESKVGK